MPFPTAPDVTKRTNLRASYRGETFLILNPNTVVFKCRVDGTPSGGSIADIAIKSITIGAIADALEGYTVKISRTDNIRAAYFDGRIRRHETAGSVLRLNENSAAIENDDYVFVVKDVKLRERLPRVDGGVLYADYDVPFDQLAPTVRGLQSAYAIQQDGGGDADLALAPIAQVNTSGATAGTWNWMQVDGASFQSGSSSTQNVTLRWTTPGVKWVRVAHTDSASRVGWFTFVVVVVDEDLEQTVPLNDDDLAWEGDLDDGWNARVRAFTGVENVLDDTLAIVATFREQFGADTAPVVSNINFVGRLRTEAIALEDSEAYTALAETRYTIEGPSAQLGRLPSAAIALRDHPLPTEWGEITNLTLWRATVFQSNTLSTLANVHSLTFEDTSDSYRVPLLGTEDTSASDNLRDTLFGINAWLVFAPQGDAYVARNVNYLNSGDRPSTPVYTFSVDDGDLVDYEIEREHVPSVGRMIGYAGAWDVAANNVTVVQAIAPAVAPGSAQGKGEINSQVLAVNLDVNSAQSEAAARVARELAQRNPKDAMTVRLIDSHHWLTPAVHQVYAFDIPASETTSGRTYTSGIHWICTSVSIVADNEVGSKAVEATFERTTQSGDSLVYAQIAPGDNEPPRDVIPPPATDTIPPIDDLGISDADDPPDEMDNPTWDGNNPNGPAPNEGDNPVPGQNLGNLVALMDSGGLWITNNLTKAAVPTWVDRRPAGFGLVDLALAKGGGKANVTQHDGDDTNVWRNVNLWGNAEWPPGVKILNELYGPVRIAATGSPLIYSPTGIETTVGTQVYTDPFTSGLGANTFFASADRPFGWQSASTPAGVWSSTDGRSNPGCIKHTTVSGTNEATVVVDVGFEVEVTAASFWARQGLAGGSQQRVIRFWNSAKSFISGAGGATGTSNSWIQQSFAGSVSGVRYISFTTHVTPTIISTRLDDISITYNPEISGFAVSRYSDDGGATFDPVQIVGASPGTSGGFDVQRVGNGVLAAEDEQVRIAAGGGSYADEPDGATSGTYAEAILYYGLLEDNYLFATADGRLFRVHEGARSEITPNDGTNDGVPVGQHCIACNGDGSRILYVADFGGTLKLARSTNSGTSWSFASPLPAGSRCVDINPYNYNQVVIAGGGLLYSGDFGATLTVKGAPGSNHLAVWFKR